MDTWLKVISCCWVQAFPCKVVGQINLLGALGLDGIVENGEGCCVVCKAGVKLELLLLLLPPNCMSCCNFLSLLQRGMLLLGTHWLLRVTHCFLLFFPLLHQSA